MLLVRIGQVAAAEAGQQRQQLKHPQWRVVVHGQDRKKFITL